MDRLCDIRHLSRARPLGYLSQSILTRSFYDRRTKYTIATADSSTVLSYSGPFTIEFRKEFLDAVKLKVKDLGFHYENVQDFNLSEILIDQLTVREWNYAGLPEDALSVENAIITMRSKRWPLIVDPQMQANKWIKNYFKNDGIRFFKITYKNMFNSLKDCVTNGYPCLIESVEQSLDSSLEPILQKQVFKAGAGLQINMGGDKPIPYSNLFKLFMTSKLANPHYLPEVTIKVTLINFTVTQKGLEDQLLVNVVKNERPDLEQIKDELIFQINEDNKVIKDLEEEILKLVKESGDDILDSDNLVNKLEQSNVKSTNIKKKLETAEKTAIDINRQRKSYKKVAVRGSILYFVISNLAKIDPMYNYSLEFFVKLFNQRLEKSEANDDVDQRISILIEDLTISFYEKICRGLFEKDKLLYSFLITVTILLDDQINSNEWGFFLRKPDVQMKGTKQKPAFLTEKQFNDMLKLKDVDYLFNEIEESFINDEQQWLKLCASEEPHNLEFPSTLVAKQITDFQKLLIIQIIRNEKLIGGIKNFIQIKMDQRFIESPPFNVEGAFEDSVKSTPIIFILTPGADPAIFLRELSRKKGIKLNNLSLGQGQGEIAHNMIIKAREKGEWVMLENCHLSMKWMPELENIQEDMNDETVNDAYRLFLTSMPDPKFPISILQNGVKITNEPPKGIKASLKGTFSNITDEDYDRSKKPFEYRKLLFALAFFHAVIIERKKYGPLGWNKGYEWMNSDFETSKKHLAIYIDNYKEVPFKILRFLIGDINYGGRVTDDKDMKLIQAILANYVNDLIFDDYYKFSDDGVYFAPTTKSISEVRTYLEKLPLDDSPDIFGLHANANIELQKKTVKEFMDPLVNVYPRSGGAGSLSPSAIVQQLNTDLELKMREVSDGIALPNEESKIIYMTDRKGLKKKTPIGNFLIQERDKFSALLDVISTTFNVLKLAIDGKIVMSLQFEKVFDSFLEGKVPQMWQDKAYPCLKPLVSWIDDLIERIHFLNKCFTLEGVSAFWLSAFYFPQGFNTAVLQSHARKNGDSISNYTFRTNPLPMMGKDMKAPAKEGVYVYGLYLNGAAWDGKKGTIVEQTYGTLFQEMPAIWLEPVSLQELRKIGHFECPLYKTSQRWGELSTTGHSTNFVMYFYLKCDEDPDHWIRRGAAMITQLDD